MNRAALALATAPLMIVHSDILGPLEVAPEEVVTFPDGLFGFPECRSFVLLPAEREGLFWLQSLDHGALAFLLVDPFLYFESYEVDIGPAQCAELRAEGPADVAVLAIVTLPRSRQEQPTANLLGPVALNVQARIGRQLAISDRGWDTRAPLDLLNPRGSLPAG